MNMIERYNVFILHVMMPLGPPFFKKTILGDLGSTRQRMSKSGTLTLLDKYSIDL